MALSVPLGGIYSLYKPVLMARRWLYGRYSRLSSLLVWLGRWVRVSWSVVRPQWWRMLCEILLGSEGSERELDWTDTTLA